MTQTTTITRNQANRLMQILQVLDKASVSEAEATKAGLSKKLQFNSKVSYWLTRNMKILGPILEAIIESRNKLVARFATDGNPENISLENREKFNKEFAEMVAEKETVAFCTIDWDILQIGFDNNEIPASLLSELLDVLVIKPAE